MVRVHKTKEKPKKPRRPRKDKGKKKKSIAAILTGIKLTPAEHLDIINRHQSPEEIKDDLHPITPLNISVLGNNITEKIPINRNIKTGLINVSPSLPVIKKNETEKEKTLCVILNRENLDATNNSSDVENNEIILQGNMDSEQTNNDFVLETQEELGLLILPLESESQEDVQYTICTSNNFLDNTLKLNSELPKINSLEQTATHLQISSENSESINIPLESEVTAANIWNKDNNGEVLATLSTDFLLLEKCNELNCELTTINLPEPIHFVDSFHAAENIHELVDPTVETEITSSDGICDKAKNEQLLDIQILGTDSLLLEKCDEVLTQFHMPEQDCFN